MRPAVAADAPSVRALVRAAYAKWIPRIGREPRPMTADYERAIREHELTLLFVDGELAALLELVPHADHVFIENVAVLPERQGQGLGRRLLAHAEDQARRRDLDEVRLETNAAMKTNVALYRSLGYRVDREEPYLGGRAIHMSKRLET
jgi:ribosomal protein S18 acetylase RimI-like enzyme